MEQTDHHLIVGAGAQSFRASMGFAIEDDLNTARSSKLWLEWKRRIDPAHYLDPEKRAEAGTQGMQMVAEGLIDREHFYGTINCDALHAKGETGGVTTTSGLAWKIAGRVGDSPVLGAGLYVDGESRGGRLDGPRRSKSLRPLLVSHRREHAARHVSPGRRPGGLKRIKANTVEKRLLNSKGNPNFGINFYIINAKGEYAGVTMYEGSRASYAICNDKGPQTLTCDGLLPGKAET